MSRKWIRLEHLAPQVRREYRRRLGVPVFGREQECEAERALICSKRPCVTQRPIAQVDVRHQAVQTPDQARQRLQRAVACQSGVALIAAE